MLRINTPFRVRLRSEFWNSKQHLESRQHVFVVPKTRNIFSHCSAKSPRARRHHSQPFPYRNSDNYVKCVDSRRHPNLRNVDDLPKYSITTNNNTEGADGRFPFAAVFKELPVSQRVLLRFGWNLARNLGLIHRELVIERKLRKCSTFGSIGWLQHFADQSSSRTSTHLPSGIDRGPV
jgi:hypothetical protein